MGLFDKKYCDVCGEKIRFLGNKKLEDGNLCKNCEALLSPWFSDRRRSTVETIKAQLADREANREKVRAFRATLSLGEGSVLCLDEEKRQFMVRRGGGEPNPDVVDLSQVTGCEVEVEHSKTEEKTKNAEGKPVSYDPPRYTYSYRFYLHIFVNHPWFDDMRFRINQSAVEIKTGIPLQLPGILAAAKVFSPDRPDTDRSADYQRYAALGEDMRRALLGAPQAQPVSQAPAPPPRKTLCAACGAQAAPDERGCCPYCGERMA